jgi:predicted metal-dependent HD superfamily phosphohydrolase
MTADELVDRWPLPDHRAERDALLTAYGDPARGYHDALHLTEVLARIDELAGAGFAPEGPAVRLAAWFHDAVYDRLRGDEDRSAIWAEDALAATPYAAEVARLVRLTEHHDAGADDVAGQVLCDADLAILAAETARYDTYVAGVRRDYAHLSDADFTAGRAAVLRDLTGRDRLFHTAYARERWEPAARANLARELAALDPEDVIRSGRRGDQDV